MHPFTLFLLNIAFWTVLYLVFGRGLEKDKEVSFWWALIPMSIISTLMQILSGLA